MPTALVTGASRGIGRATALRLAARGWRVFAGVRREEDGAELVAAGSTVSPIRLDITDPLDVASLDDNLPDCLDAVVNNAGVLVHGPIEGVPLDSLRGQFEVNIVGHVAVTQAVLPRLREAQGTVVFMSSLSGRIATPMTGIHNATKFALEGLADSLVWSCVRGESGSSSLSPPRRIPTSGEKRRASSRLRLQCCLRNTSTSTPNTLMDSASRSRDRSGWRPAPIVSR